MFGAVKQLQQPAEGGRESMAGGGAAQGEEGGEAQQLAAAGGTWPAPTLSTAPCVASRDVC